MSKRGDESLQVFRQSPSELAREKARAKEESPKKRGSQDIIKMLEDLADNEEVTYKQEFDSYREES